ncbi:hypothetical protein ACIBL8_17725 [Streptomyces sp. NPDC050523]|uniref:hypothetical protein n=1 Tax=Streptomyces sp. NPDC050523 TaxID=3365622 RepID=UPI0037A3DCAB
MSGLLMVAILATEVLALVRMVKGCPSVIQTRSTASYGNGHDRFSMGVTPR